jgi:hypothetical protein
MASAVAALIVSAFFNLIMISLLCSVFFAKNGENVIEDTIKLMTFTGTLLAFLVGPAIGFFFSHARAARRPRAPQAPGGQPPGNKGQPPGTGKAQSADSGT